MVFRNLSGSDAQGRAGSAKPKAHANPDGGVRLARTLGARARSIPATCGLGLGLGLGLGAGCPYSKRFFKEPFGAGRQCREEARKKLLPRPGNDLSRRETGAGRVSDPVVPR